MSYRPLRQEKADASAGAGGEGDPGRAHGGCETGAGGCAAGGSGVLTAERGRPRQSRSAASALLGPVLSTEAEAQRPMATAADPARRQRPEPRLTQVGARLVSSEPAAAPHTCRAHRPAPWARRLHGTPHHESTTSSGGNRPLAPREESARGPRFPATSPPPPATPSQPLAGTRVPRAHLGGIGGLIHGLVPDEEVQVVDAPEHSPLGSVDDLGRLSDGNTFQKKARGPPSPATLIRMAKKRQHK